MSQDAVGSQDRRIKRSKAALRKALIELINERGLENFSVNELCVRAELNRGTFYNHFKDKDDLVHFFEMEILHGMERLQLELKDLSFSTVWAYKISKKPLPVLVDMFDYLSQESEFLMAIVGPRGDALFAQRLRDTICNDFVMGILHEQYRESPTPFVSYYVTYYASAYMGVMVQWIQSGMHETSEEMAVIALRLLFIKPGESIEL